MNNPGKNVFIKSIRSLLFMGFRSVRTDTSASVGFGVCSSNHVKNKRGIKNTRPVTHGIHHWSMPHFNKINFPALCVKPEAKMKLEESAAPRNSVVFLPSK